MTEHVIEISRSNEPLAGEPDETSMTSWLKTVLKRLDCGPVELSIRLVSEEEMVSLNQQYRGKAAVTNVLSFPSGLEAEGHLFLGDIVICSAVVLKEAEEFDKPFAERYAHMIVHGLLHLLGHDHIEPAAREAMETLEQTMLAALGMDDPYEVTVASTETV